MSEAYSFDINQNDKIEDEVVRDSFNRLDQVLADQLMLQFSGRVIEMTFDAAVSGYVQLHHLGFIPTDILTTSISNGAVVTWNYDSNDREYINLDVDKACTVRALVGSFE